MPIRWKMILPFFGMLLFLGITFDAVRQDRPVGKKLDRYFWWSAIRLDKDPLSKYYLVKEVFPCEESNDSNCIAWDFETHWVDPGWVPRILFITALPAFIVGEMIVHSLGQFGVSQVWSFFVSMPLLIFVWFFLVGWLIDRWRLKRRVRVDAGASTAD